MNLQLIAPEWTMLIVAVLLWLGVMASKLSSKLGVPSLILFLGVGMLFGSDGPGGIEFDNAKLAQFLGTLALSFILFSGGLDTRWADAKPVVTRGLLLSTVGVGVTALLVGWFAQAILGFTLLEGLLLGSVIASTDAAAVFNILRARGIRLRGGLGALLEFESGTNDPVAVFLTLTFTGALMQHRVGALDAVFGFLLEMLLGAMIGAAMGWITARFINTVRLEVQGLYTVVTFAAVPIAFGCAGLIHGNGFLAVYVAGIVLGNQRHMAKHSIAAFHEAIAWVMQIAMFLMLGLLAFPSRLPAVAISGVLLAVFLTLIARPLAVAIILTPFGMSWKKQLLVSWGGLRGAVPIILATFPLTAGVPIGERLFDLILFTVLLSVMIQGTTLSWLAKKLKLTVEAESQKGLSHAEGTFELQLPADAPIVGKRVVDLDLPNTAILALVRRGNTSSIPTGSTVLLAGDVLLVATRKNDADSLRIRIAGPNAQAEFHLLPGDDGVSAR